MAQGYAKKEFADPGWQTWSPTPVNITVGNGTINARYTQVGTTVHAVFEFTLGSTSSIDGDVQVPLPVTANSAAYTNADSIIGACSMGVQSGRFLGIATYVSASPNTLIRVANASSSYVGGSVLSSTIPGNWGTNDVLSFSLTYEAATSVLIGMGLNNDHGALSGLTDDDHSAYPAYDEWQDWVPTYANMTIGNGTVVARYVQIGKLVTCHFSFTLGSTSVMATNPKVATPVTAASTYIADRNVVGSLYMLDSGTLDYPGMVRLNSTTVFVMNEWVTIGSHTALAAIGSVSPFVWTTSDIISFTATYEAATAV